eukprot:883032-Prorocentrum_lima.AAC.1
MAQELQMTVIRVPGARPQLGMWLEDYIHKLDCGMILGAMLEPRTTVTLVKDTMETVASNDDLLKKAMMEYLSEPTLRTPQSMEE